MDEQTAFRDWCAQAMRHATEALERDPNYEATIDGATLLRLLKSAAQAADR